MNTTNQAPGSPSGSPRSVWITFTLFFITVLALAVVIYLIVQPSEQQREVILNLVESAPDEVPEVNVGSIIDLSEQPDAAVVLGGRYRVQIRENSRDGSSGMVRIGGMITFVDGAAAGDDAVIEITRVRATTAQAVALSVESRDTLSAPPPRPAPVSAPRSPSFSSGGMVGGVLTGVVSYIGSRGDGAVKINGKPVYVKGASVVNQQVVFRVSREEDAYAVGDLQTANMFAHRALQQLDRNTVDYRRADDIELITDPSNPDNREFYDRMSRSQRGQRLSLTVSDGTH